MFFLLGVVPLLAPAGGPPTRFVEPDGLHATVFGFSAAVGDDLAVVGAPLDDTLGKHAGAVFVYERIAPARGSVQFVGPDWRLVAKITASDGYEGDQFGYAVALAGSTILVGAPLDSCGPSEGHATECGALYVIELDSTGGWTETKLRSSGDRWDEKASLRRGVP